MPTFLLFLHFFELFPLCWISGLLTFVWSSIFCVLSFPGLCVVSYRVPSALLFNFVSWFLSVKLFHFMCFFSSSSFHLSLDFSGHKEMLQMPSRTSLQTCFPFNGLEILLFLLFLAFCLIFII